MVADGAAATADPAVIAAVGSPISMSQSVRPSWEASPMPPQKSSSPQTGVPVNCGRSPAREAATGVLSGAAISCCAGKALACWKPSSTAGEVTAVGAMGRGAAAGREGVGGGSTGGGAAEGTAAGIDGAAVAVAGAGTGT